MALNWDEIEREGQSKYLKISDGQTVTVEFLSEPDKSKNQYGKTQYSAKVMVDNQVLDWSFSPLLMHQVGEAIGRPDSLIKRVVTVSRVGSTREDTRYTVKPFKD